MMEFKNLRTNLLIAAFSLSFAVSYAAGQEPKAASIPPDIQVKVVLDDLPGATDDKTFWEGTYEIRIADWADIVIATREQKGLEQVGVVLKKGSWTKRSITQSSDRTFEIQVPTKGLLRQRMEHQRKTPQAFLLKSSIRVFDGRLGKNFALQIDRVWEAKLFPDGQVRISIKIAPDESYSVWGPLPASMPAGYTIVGGKP